MGRNYHWTNQEISSVLCGWRFDIVELVHRDINTKKGILL